MGRPLKQLEYLKAAERRVSATLRTAESRLSRRLFYWQRFVSVVKAEQRGGGVLTSGEEIPRFLYVVDHERSDAQR